MLRVGSEVAGYRIDGVIGRGGMGVVYEACQLALRRTVALKVLASELRTDIVFRVRFRREGEIQAALDHPHIVTVYEAGEMEEGLFLAMRLVRGPNLKNLILGRELDAARTMRLLTPIADALDAAHAAGLIHRDIKPHNILVEPTDRPFLADFGLTKAVNEAGPTKPGGLVGTIDYVSPEQIRGDPASRSSDVYALAGVLYECLTGVVPFPKPSEGAVLFAHMSDPPPRVTDKRPELPEALDAVICRAMAKDPCERHASAIALIDDAQRAFGHRAGAVITPPRSIRAPRETGIGPAAQALATAADAATAPIESAGTHVVEDREPTSDRRRSVLGAISRLRAGATLAALAVAGVAGFASAQAGGPAAPATAAPLPGSASSSGLELRFPAGWHRLTPPEVPGMRFADAIAVAPGAGTTSAIVAGFVDAKGPRLLSTAGVVGSLPRSDAVALGGLHARRYRGVHMSGLAEQATFYAVPTDRGVATVACLVAPSAAAQFAGDCERVAASLNLLTGRVYPLGPSTAYAGRVAGVLSMLARARGSAGANLRRSKTSKDQAAVAGDLRDAYDVAARALGALTVSPADAQVDADLVVALRRAASAFADLKAAASRRSVSAYRTAREATMRRVRRVVAAIGQLESAGYKVT